jgi:hypothetical protein
VVPATIATADDDTVAAPCHDSFRVVTWVPGPNNQSIKISSSAAAAAFLLLLLYLECRTFFPSTIPLCNNNNNNQPITKKEFNSCAGGRREELKCHHIFSSSSHLPLPPANETHTLCAAQEQEGRSSLSTDSSKGPWL